MIAVIQKPAFQKAYKKLSRHDKESVDEAIRAVIREPQLGQEKKGDLVGGCVYKFKIDKQEKLLAYVFNKIHLILLALGTHENFYRDLKKNR